MAHRIYTDKNEATDYVYENIHDAEQKLREFPSGWWIDTWYYEYLEDIRQRQESFYNFD